MIARELAEVAVFGLVFLALVDLSWRFLDTFGRPIYWFPEGFAAGILLRVDRSRWPAFVVAIPAVLLAAGALGFPEARHPPVAIALAWALEDAAVPFAVAYALERFVGRPVTLASTREIVALLVASLLIVPAVGAVVELPIWWLWPEGRITVTFAETMLGYTSLYSIPVLGLVPVIVTWPRRLPRHPSPGSLLEFVTIVALVVVLTWIAFFLPSEAGSFVAILIAAFPVLGWGAARFGVAAAAQGAFALSVVGTLLTLAGEGPFGAPGFGIDRIVIIQGFFAVAMIAALIVAAEATAAREHLARSEETLARLDTLTASAPVGIYVIDPALRFERANETVARITGWPLADIVGRPFGEVAGVVTPQVEPIIRRVLETGRPITDVEVARIDGPTRRYLLGSYYPIRVGAGPIRGVGALVVDITERKRQEVELARLVREAREAVRARDDFLSIASHELKTPLTPLLTRLQWLRRRIVSGAPADVATVDKALASIHRLCTLINDLLDVSRIEQGGLALHTVPVDLVEVVREAAGAASAGAVSAGQADRIRLELPEAPVWIDADGPRLSQVVDSLLSNAIKYSPLGGAVRVRLEIVGNEVVLSVADQGIGIPADQIAFLFDRFFRARNASSTSYGGLGLGLHIAQDIVVRHGGRIWAESEVGRGSTFYVALPVRRAGATSDRGEPRQIEAGPPGPATRRETGPC